MRPILPLLTALLLAACASRDVAPRFPPLVCPEQTQAGVEARMIGAATGMWQRFGGAVIDWRDGSRKVIGPGRSEREPELAPMLRTFWQAVPTPGGGFYANQEGRSRPDAPAFEVAWSAAFISWLACAAGVPEGMLPRHEAHYAYVDATILGMADPARWFRPREILQHAPKPGDLICLDRSGATRRLSSWAERVPEVGQARPMHCDLVVETGPGVIQAIGGNVEDTVARSLYPADAEGRLYPLGGSDASGWFVILAR